jgi:uncharacterized protein YceK
MKKLISLVLTLGLLITLSGCAAKDTVTKSNGSVSNSTRFIDTGDSYAISGWTYRVYYDSKTNIIYLGCSQVNASGITIMYNVDRQPMTLDEYNKTK